MRNPWVRLPSAWIDAGRLADLSWTSGGGGADNAASLMVLTAIAHDAEQVSGVARLTYDQLCAVTGLSRAKVSNGLEILRKMAVITPGPNSSRSTYSLANFDTTNGWAKLPLRSMILNGTISSFTEFRLRRATELDALKLFFLFVARRGRDTNLANIGYTKIEEYTGIKRVRIKSAVSFLASLSLVYVEHVPSEVRSGGIANAYRIVGLDSYNHLGTRGRGMTQMDLPGSEP